MLDQRHECRRGANVKIKQFRNYLCTQTKELQPLLQSPFLACITPYPIYDASLKGRQLHSNSPPNFPEPTTSTMPSTIYLVRHAESEHNISKDFSHHDPPLTALGQTQAAKLTTTFPHPERIGAILSSPLRRAIQTSLAGFSHILDKRYYEPSTNLGVENGLLLTLDAGLQERSDLPCDTGSANGVLASEFFDLNVGGLEEGWMMRL